jgi:hypothetical protein
MVTHDGGCTEGSLDTQSFPAYARLLEACQEYADISGCRFPKGCLQQFEAPAPEEKSAQPSKMQVATTKAAPVVKEFKDRLLRQEKELIESLEAAHRRVMSESVRNGVVATCRELELWPPEPAPKGIAEDDCAFEDMSEVLPVIAQRVYNDEMRRNKEEVLQFLSRRAVTASFIVDFATEVGVDLPLSETHRQMLQEFMDRVDDWIRSRGQEQQANPTGTSPLASRARQAILLGIGSAAAASGLRQQVKEQWSKNWESTGGTIFNIAMMGLAAAAAAATVHRAAARGRK